MAHRLPQVPALSEAISDLRRRRGIEAPDVLLDESLALLESLTTSPIPRPGRGTPTPDDPFPEIHGTSPEISTLKRHMLHVAHDAEVTVLIVGESGTGKERVARGVHRASPRHRAPFVIVNCAGLSPTLVEDELFGHVRGAFTGAVDDRPGPFERASGGTVFLDEVGDLTPDLQMKLLRALQQRTVQRLGSRHETAFDVRVIAATHVDLTRAKARGHFREDLYYRLNVYELHVPPLRRRGAADLQHLTQAILTRLGERRQRPRPSLDPAVMDLLMRYRWPGNVRELENTLERMIVAAAGAPLLTCDHLAEGFRSRVARMTGVEAERSGTITTKARPRLSAAELLDALARNDFKSGQAAADLGLSRHQLYRLLKHYDVRPPRPHRQMVHAPPTPGDAPGPDSSHGGRSPLTP